MSEANLNEFRQDLVSGEWVLFSTGRTHSIRKFENQYQPKESCPFEDLERSGQEVVWRYPEGEDWRVALIKNKFPAVRSSTVCPPTYKVGEFSVHDAVGEHEIFVFREHDRQLSDFSVEEFVHVLAAYKKRKQELKQPGSCISYIMIFNNFGSEAGASLFHPHSQVISTPILPPFVSKSLNGAYRFYKEHNARVYDVMLDWEKEQAKRIVCENKNFIAFCPFASRFPYEVRIFSKSGESHFDELPEDCNADFAEIFTTVLGKIKKALNDPPYNFFIHVPPLESDLENIHKFYRWHVEILPKVSIAAGFEMGTGIDINVVDPDQAARTLREA